MNDVTIERAFVAVAIGIFATCFLAGSIYSLVGVVI